MESRIKGRVLSIIIAAAMIASTSTVSAATTKPLQKVSQKTTNKPASKKTAAKKPAPQWPPRTPPFVNPQKGEIYYRIPKSQELAGALSAAAALTKQIVPCTKFACGVVIVGSTNGCTWWEIDSTVYGPLSSTDFSPVPYGNLSTTVKGTNRREIVTVLLVSAEHLKNNVHVGSLQIYCHHDPVTTAPQRVPSYIYTLSTPTPEASPSNVAVTNTN